MKRIVSAVVVLTVAALLAPPVRAEITETLLGGFLYGNGGRTTYIGPKGAEGDSLAYTGQFGLMWSEPVTVYSLSVELHTAGGGRAIPGVVRVYTSQLDFQDFLFADVVGEGESPVYGNYTMNFPGGIQADNSYLMVVVYMDSLAYRGDTWVGVYTDTVTANVVSLGKGADVNLHDPANGVLVAMDFIEGAIPPPVDNGGDVRIAYDGRIHSDNKQSGGRDAIYFTGPGNTQGLDAGTLAGLTATYLTPQTIGSIGLGFAGDGADRTLPDTFTIIGTFANGETTSMDFYVKGDFVDGQWEASDATQYMRFTLDETFVDIVSLTLSIPMPDGNYGYLGITEFQAFAVVPEPATMTLLALGGLTLLRRRK
ncbi:MAG: PEP-CTERM sorting domain-containing protein [Phycisphaerae bacterium]|nr:PEP-CTERM sorting domain-containing protein [Phycisphaerae bacterium]